MYDDCYAKTCGASLARLFTRPLVNLRPYLYPVRFLSIIVFSTVLSFIATFRSFGFDMDGTLSDYPYVAESWGIWYFLARHLEFVVFFFVANFILASAMSVLTFPRPREGYSKYPTLQITTVLYMSLWFLFGQARYGSAVGLVVCAINAEGIPLAVALFALAFFIHKAIAGGIAVVLLWKLLRRKKHGVLIALSICAIASFLINQAANYLLVLSGYLNYLNWETLPAANTPYKYLGFGLLLTVWLWAAKDGRGKNAAKEMLILTLLFFPSSLYLVSAGRGYELYAVIMLTLLAQNAVPVAMRYMVMPAYLIDLYILLFHSPLY